MLNSIQTNNYVPHLNGVVDKYNSAKFDTPPQSSSPVLDDDDGPGFSGDASKEAIEHKVSELFSRYPNGGVERKSHPLGLDIST
ncbi:MAG: hypothetical protein HQL69_11410 [Magnetococcales bacterium]|nr:hypothetical protein [Magnetococcales bacterium]